MSLPVVESTPTIRTYSGRTFADLATSFEAEAAQLAREGYRPVGQFYMEGEWGFWRGMLALLLTPFLVGLFMWVQILTTNPIGALVVTYDRRP